MPALRRTAPFAALALCLCASTPAFPAEAVSSRRLDSEDCKVFVVLGRELLRWGERPPDERQFPIFYRPSGETYVEQCAWKRLGVTPPAPGVPQLDSVVFFTAPAYGHGHRSATVGVVTRIKGVGLYMSQKDCRLEKAASRWRLVACDQGPMT